MKMLKYVLSILVLSMAACSSDDPAPEPPLGTPATEHHENDKSVDNGDGTTTVTMGNVEFTTVERDFSNDPVVTDPKTVSAVKDSDFAFSNYVSRFKAPDTHIIGFKEIDAFTSSLTVHSIADNAETSTHAPDSYIAGLDYNGAIMTVEGSEDINFYKVENGVISDHFFHIGAFQGSKFLTECFLDNETAFVYNTNEIFMFPLHNTTSVSTMNVTIPDFSNIRFVADEKYLYLSIGGLNDSEVKILDKNNGYSEVHVMSLPGLSVVGITVDANYIYVSDDNSDDVQVYNKHTYAYSGAITIPTAQGLDIIGDLLYVSRKDNKTIERYKVSFN